METKNSQRSTSSTLPVRKNKNNRRLPLQAGTRYHRLLVKSSAWSYMPKLTSRVGLISALWRIDHT